jgi:hypothetical protein
LADGDIRICEMFAPAAPSIMQWCTLFKSAKLLAALQSLDHPDLPERARAVERTREDPARELAQLIERARAREREVAQVVADVEVAIVDPHRPALERRPRELLAIARDPVQHRLDRAAVAREVDAAVRVAQRARLEDRDRADVHRRVLALRPQERGVLRRESFVGITSHAHLPFAQGESKCGANPGGAGGPSEAQLLSG